MKNIFLLLFLSVPGFSQGMRQNGANSTQSGPITFSSATFVGTYLSTQAVGGAGVAVTATCLPGFVAYSGGCNCSGIVGATAVIGTYNCSTQLCVPNGWTCQDSGATGGTCSSFALCTRLQ